MATFQASFAAAGLTGLCKGRDVVAALNGLALWETCMLVLWFTNPSSDTSKDGLALKD